MYFKGLAASGNNVERIIITLDRAAMSSLFSNDPHNYVYNIMGNIEQNNVIPSAHIWFYLFPKSTKEKKLGRLVNSSGDNEIKDQKSSQCIDECPLLMRVLQMKGMSDKMSSKQTDSTGH